MDAGRQQHRLAVVDRVANVALLDDHDRAVAVGDVSAERDRRAHGVEEELANVVHTRLGKEVLIGGVHQQPDVPSHGRPLFFIRDSP